MNRSRPKERVKPFCTFRAELSTAKEGKKEKTRKRALHFANARNDGKRYSEGAARRISLNKRYFATAQDDNVTLLHCGGLLC